MAKKPPSPFPFPPKRVYSGANIPMRVIRRYVRAIADEFQPDKIILFGSYAYGTPHEGSDVDLLVIMPTWEHAQQVGANSMAAGAAVSARSARPHAEGYEMATGRAGVVHDDDCDPGKGPP
jgi:hypothetical protein